MKICVFCSSQEITKKYSVPALEAVRGFASRGHSLVWGGSDTGLMKKVATTAQNEGVAIIGVSVEFLKHKARTNADEMTIAADLAERKALMIEKSDAFLVLPGGVGTLDEVMEILEEQKHGEIYKPVVFLDIDDFYHGMMSQLERMESDGFLTKPLDEIAAFAQSTDQALTFLGIE